MAAAAGGSAAAEVIAEATAPVVRKTAADFAAMARGSASRGSHRYVHVTAFDDRHTWPIVRVKSDNPFKHLRVWTRMRWLVQDIRMFGAWSVLRKWHYMGPVWNKKGEKVFQGRDENGNLYWSGNDSFGRAMNGRFIEPVDPHWFRGADHSTPSPAWYLWLTGVIAHTPAQMKARGEYGYGGRIARSNPYNLHYWPGMYMTHGIDPGHVPQTGMIISPWYKQLREAGFSRWTTNMGIPMFMPMQEPHDLKPEVVEDFYRGQAIYARWSRGHDHDEWVNG